MIQNNKTIQLILSGFLVLGLSACSFNNNIEQVKLKEHSFSKDGFNSLKINDKASLNTFNEIDDSRIGECYFATQKSIDDVKFQIINNLVSVISTRVENISSYTGINVGDTEEKIYAKHSSMHLQKIKNPYGESGDYALIFWNDKSKKMGTRYDVEDKVITSISIGNENLTLMEGCA